MDNIKSRTDSLAMLQLTNIIPWIISNDNRDIPIDKNYCLDSFKSERKNVAKYQLIKNCLLDNFKNKKEQ